MTKLSFIVVQDLTLPDASYPFLLMQKHNDRFKIIAKCDSKMCALVVANALNYPNPNPKGDPK